MSSTPVSNKSPLPDPIPVRSVYPYGRPTPEEYAHMFNNYGGGVNPLGYMGHEFAPDGSYGYRPPSRPGKPLRKPTRNLPPQPKPASFDVGFDDEAVLSMPIPEPVRNQTQRSAPESQQDDSCCPLISRSSGAIPLPWACVTQSTVLNRYVFFTWRLLLLVLSMSALVVSFVFGVTTSSLIVPCAFTVAVMKDISVSLALLSYYVKRRPIWKENDLLWVIGTMFQIAAHVTLAAPLVLFNNYLFASSGDSVEQFVKSPSAYFLSVQFFVVLLDVLFTPLPPRLYGVLIGSLVIGLSGIFAVTNTAASKLLVALGVLTASSVGLGLILHFGISAVYFYLHAPRLSRMLTSSKAKESNRDTFSAYGYS